MHWLRRLLRNTFLALIALILLFEEWGWEPLAALLAKLARLPLWAAIERRIRALPPWAAVAVFALPALALLPVKLLALFLIGRGHALLGVGVLLTLTEPALLRLAWFARWYPRWKSWKDGVIAQLRCSAPWQAALRWKARARRQWAAFRLRHGLAA